MFSEILSLKKEVDRDRRRHSKLSIFMHVKADPLPHSPYTPQTHPYTHTYALGKRKMEGGREGRKEEKIKV